MNKKIECIKRLFKKNQAYHEICNWLLERELITELERDTHSRDQERAEFIYSVLEKCVEDKTFMLLDFEWQVLPIEQIKIYIVTEKEEHEFTYGH